MSRKYWVFAAASLGFCFVTATTFTSLGYVLYTMAAELGWSHAAAGASFALLGLACGLGSPLPPLLIRHFGSRLTILAGLLILAGGFVLASRVEGIGPFFLATGLMGVGFSLVAPSPGVFLIATWFPERPARLMGVYFMAGAIGGIVGPLIVGTILTLTGSWRMHWLSMGGAAVALALLSLFAVRDAVTVVSAAQVRDAAVGPADARSQEWTLRAALLSPSFILIALVMLSVQTVITTLHSVLVAHVASLGGSGAAAAGALAMSMLALTGAVAKGVTGSIADRYGAKPLMIAGLALQGIALGLLSLAEAAALAIGASLLLGIGWGLAWVSAHILLLRYFGSALAGELTAMATMATTLAVLGPVAAGRLADVSGSFVPIFMLYAAMMAATAIVTAQLLRAPRASRLRPAVAPDGAAELHQKARLVPAE